MQKGFVLRVAKWTFNGEWGVGKSEYSEFSEYSEYSEYSE